MAGWKKSKATGTFTGRSELKLELTGIVVNGQTLPLVTGEYEVAGKSKTESTAKRTVGGAAIGSIIGALAAGGKGAAVGAGTGAGVGAGSEVISKGDQVKIPSETLLDFTLEQIRHDSETRSLITSLKEVQVTHRIASRGSQNDMVQSWSTNQCQLLLNTLLGATRVAYFQSVTG